MDDDQRKACMWYFAAGAVAIILGISSGIARAQTAEPSQLYVSSWNCIRTTVGIMMEPGEPPCLNPVENLPFEYFAENQIFGAGASQYTGVQIRVSMVCPYGYRPFSAFQDRQASAERGTCINEASPFDLVNVYESVGFERGVDYGLIVLLLNFIMLFLGMFIGWKFSIKPKGAALD